MWDARSGTEILTLRGHTGGVTSASFSPDGSRIVTGGGTAKMWDARSGAEILTLRGHASGGTSASLDPMTLNKTSWMIARDPRRTPEDYRRALRYAEAACRLDPRESTYINTLGVARYRAGLYREALADLTRSLTLNAPRFGGPIPADLAFLALAQHRLRQTESARAALGRLRAAMKKPQWANDQESQGFLREAEAIEQDLVFPADLFAP